MICNKRRIRRIVVRVLHAEYMAEEVVCPQPSSGSNSLLTGKLTGNFANSAQETPLRTPLSYLIDGSCRHACQIFLRNRTGNSHAVTGNGISLLRGSAGLESNVFLPIRLSPRDNSIDFEQRRYFSATVSERFRPHLMWRVQGFGLRKR